MICDSCQWAGHHNFIGKTDMAKDFHDRCKGDCPCQHQTGRGWFVRLGEKAKPMQLQSP